MNVDKCMIYLKSKLSHTRSIQCAVCNMMYHLKCITLSTEYIVGFNHGSLFICNEMLFSVLTEVTKVLEYIECLFLKINSKDMSHVIGIIYRPPNSDIEQFTETLNDILSQITHVPCYIMGDYYLDLLKHECHQPTEHFLNTMYSNSMLPLIYEPTRETDSIATLIDNIFTNNYDVNDQLYQGIFLMDISDHYGIFHILDKYCEHDDCSQLLRGINESKMDRYRVYIEYWLECSECVWRLWNLL